jgi:hypothetical protein
MAAKVATWLSGPTALFIGGLGAVSMFKAACVLECACVGDSTNGPLGFVSPTRSLGMIAPAAVEAVTVRTKRLPMPAARRHRWSDHAVHFARAICLHACHAAIAALFARTR